MFFAMSQLLATSFTISMLLGVEAEFAVVVPFNWGKAA